MTVSVTFSQLNLELSEVGSVVITETALDDDLGDYVRDIRVMGVAIDGNAPMLVQLRVRSATAESIVIHAPEQEF